MAWSQTSVPIPGQLDLLRSPSTPDRFLRWQIRLNHVYLAGHQTRTHRGHLAHRRSETALKHVPWISKQRLCFSPRCPPLLPNSLRSPHPPCWTQPLACYFFGSDERHQLFPIQAELRAAGSAEADPGGVRSSRVQGRSCDWSGQLTSFPRAAC